jgi:hypothetical protein
MRPREHSRGRGAARAFGPCVGPLGVDAADMDALKPYAERTEVPVERSRAECEYLLQKAGAYSVATLMEPDRIALGFKLAGRGYRIIVPLPAVAQATRDVRASHERHEKARAQALRQRWRALALILRAKLEASLSGVTELETEFLPYAILPSGRSVAEEVAPTLAKIAETGRDLPLLPNS